MRADRQGVLAAAVLAVALWGCGPPASALQGFDLRIAALRERLDAYPPQVEGPEDFARLSRELGGLVRELQDALSRSPEDPEVEWRIGECYRMGHNLDLPDAWGQALSWLELALRHDPDSAPARESLGFLYVDAGEEWATKAREEFLEALRLSGGERPDVYFGLFYAELNLGRLEEALVAADAYLERVPENAGFRLHRDSIEDELFGAAGDAAPLLSI